jgi:hypothetical protein
MDGRGLMAEHSVEESFARSQEAFAAAREWLAGPAAGLDHAAVEEGLAARGREIQRLLFQEYLDEQAAAEPRLVQVTGPDAVTRTRAERGHARLLASVFGPVTVSRIAYRAAGAPNVHPLDGQLNMPAGKHSHGVAKMTAAAAAAGSLEQACAQVRARTGNRLGTRQAQQLTRAAACDFEDFYAGRRPPPGAAPGTVLVISCDAKGIRVRPGQLRPRAQRLAAKSVPKQPDGRLSRGEAGTRKRMAEVAAVCDLAPVPRTTGDILGPGPRPDGPQAARKWLTASVAADAADVVAAAFAEAARRDPGGEQTWIALADGNKDQIAWLGAQAAARGVTLTIIIDLIHVLEYLQDAAWCFFPEASPQAGPWVRDKAAQILDGSAGEVAAALRAAAAGLGKTKRATAEKTARYLENKAPWLDYPAALAAGWPISTGVIEGACRHLVKDRMDITGARWGIQTAEAILKLRALHANGDFDDYWTYHLEREHQRNHPSYTLAA